MNQNKTSSARQWVAHTIRPIVFAMVCAVLGLTFLGCPTPTVDTPVTTPTVDTPATTTTLTPAQVLAAIPPLTPTLPKSLKVDSSTTPSSSMASRSISVLNPSAIVGQRATGIMNFQSSMLSCDLVSKILSLFQFGVAGTKPSLTATNVIGSVAVPGGHGFPAGTYDMGSYTMRESETGTYDVLWTFPLGGGSYYFFYLKIVVANAAVSKATFYMCPSVKNLDGTFDIKNNYYGNIDTATGEINLVCPYNSSGQLMALSVKKVNGETFYYLEQSDVAAVSFSGCVLYASNSAGVVATIDQPDAAATMLFKNSEYYDGNSNLIARTRIGSPNTYALGALALKQNCVNYTFATDGSNYWLEDTAAHGTTPAAYTTSDSGNISLSVSSESAYTWNSTTGSPVASGSILNVDDADISTYYSLSSANQAVLSTATSKLNDFFATLPAMPLVPSNLQATADTILPTPPKPEDFPVVAQ